MKLILVSLFVGGVFFMFKFIEEFNRITWKVFNPFSHQLQVLMLLKDNGPSNRNYVGAVVEYSAIIHDTPRSTILENVKNYVDIIANASQYDVDIIVFPEAGLTGTTIPSEREEAKKYLIKVPSFESKSKPYADPLSDEVLQILSHAAKDYRLYVIVNLLEIQHCKSTEKDCPPDGAFFYNTNIVFDREGTIIAKYRKFNLFVEKAFNAPKEVDLCTFETDFGVTFGMFICFDILFNSPSVRLVKEKHVTDIVYSTAWFSEMPLLTAVSIQAGWAHSLDVNLLASNFNDPQMFGGGSGIYAGSKGPLVVIMPQQKGTKILIATVPKKNSHSSLFTYISDLEEQLFPSKNRKRSNSLIIPEDQNKSIFNDMKFLRDVSLQSFKLQPLTMTENKQIHVNNLSYMNDSFSCHLEVQWKSAGNSTDFTNYKMIAYSGDRNFSTASTNYIEVCGLILCAEEKISSCGILPDLNTINPNIEIESIKISAKSYNVHAIPVPVTLNSSLYSLDVSEFTFDSKIETVNGQTFYSMEMNLIKSVRNIIAFAIYKLPSDSSSTHKSTNS